MPQRVRECNCRSGQNADESVTTGELSRPRLLLVIGIGIAALIMRFYLAPPELPSDAAVPVTAAAAATVVPVVVPLVGAATAKTRDDGAKKRSAIKKRGSQGGRDDARRRSTVSPGFRFR
jgi:hypothetical protein